MSIEDSTALEVVTGEVVSALKYRKQAKVLVYIGGCFLDDAGKRVS